MDQMHPRWKPNQTIAIVATGPSLRGARLDGLAKFPVIAVNDSYRLVPFADILYACDPPWWRYHEFAPGFHGERWTQHQGPKSWPMEAAANGLRVIRSAAGHSISTDPGLIFTGWNSGFQALNLAILGGARRILLLGFDMRRDDAASHWFGEHPAPLRRSSPYDAFVRAFHNAAAEIEALGVKVVNCSPTSAITCFPRVPLESVL